MVLSGDRNLILADGSVPEVHNRSATYQLRLYLYCDRSALHSTVVHAAQLKELTFN
jgi:hypothetical protein